MGKVIINDQEVDFSSAVVLMDDDIREELHSRLAPCDEQTFADAYAEAHAEEFNGEIFTVN